mgnify:CR=1 FL=1
MGLELLTSDGVGQGSEELGDALKQARPADRDACGNLSGVEVEECGNSNNAELLVVHSGESGHVAEPQAEEAVGPSLGFQDLERQERVVVNSIDDHLEEVNLIALQLDLLCAEDGHGQCDEALDALVNVAGKAEHHGLSELASAYSLYSSLVGVREHICDH